MFKNEYERQLAIAASRASEAGAQLPEPQLALARAFQNSNPDAPRLQMASMLEAAQQAEAAARRNAIRTARPVDWTAPDDKLVQQQLAGDDTGFIKNFLYRMSGVSPERAVASNANLRQGQQAWMPKPYRPSLPSESDTRGNRAVADRNLLLDPEFRKLLSSNPTEAKAIYNRLTLNEWGLGRDLETDLKESDQYQRSALAQVASRRERDEQTAYQRAKMAEVAQENNDREIDARLKGSIWQDFYTGKLQHDVQGDRFMRRVEIEEPNPLDPMGRPVTRQIWQPVTEYADQLIRKHHPDYQDANSQWPLPDRTDEGYWNQLNSTTRQGEFRDVWSMVDAEIQRIESATGHTLSPKQKLLVRNVFMMEKLRGQQLTPVQRQHLLNEAQGGKVVTTWNSIFGNPSPATGAPAEWAGYGEQMGP